MSSIKKTTVKKTNVKNTATETPAAVVKTTVKKAEVKAPAKVTAKKEVVATPVAKKVTEKAPVSAVKPAVKATPAKATAKAKTTTKKITFSLPTEAVNQAKKVGLVGDFNDWDVNKPIELKKQKDGSFATTLELATGSEYQYRFLINGEVWENDWKADKYVPTPFGTFNSVVTVA